MPCNLRSVVSAAALFMVTGQGVAAETLKLICENPRREYLVVFDTKSRTFLINPDSDRTYYKVKSVSQSEDGLVVKGNTVKQGPDFEAFFGDGASITFLMPDPFQTDFCRHV